ncbi:MAG: hypothetical protein H7144_03480 [Burkholderiales bacterium]|nr:hypothetical protein [Phycisphaerae bacterium]
MSDEGILGPKIVEHSLHFLDSMAIISFGSIHAVSVVRSLVEMHCARRQANYIRQRRCTLCAVIATAGLVIIIFAWLFGQHIPAAMMIGRGTLIPLHALHMGHHALITIRLAAGPSAAIAILAGARWIARILDPRLPR